MRLRTATPGDLFFLMAIEMEAFDERDRLSARSMLRFVKLRKVIVFEREAGLFDDTSEVPLPAGIFGYVILTGGYMSEHDHKPVRIYSLAVRKDVRGQGVGSRLVSAAIMAARHRPVSLEVRYDNIAAILLYRKLGFTKTKALKDYYAPGVHGVRMVRGPKQLYKEDGSAVR